MGLAAQLIFLFQLTPPIQRATIARFQSTDAWEFQLTPPIQRATQALNMSREFVSISTHAPYTEGDLDILDEGLDEGLFQLTPPIQRATLD